MLTKKVEGLEEQIRRVQHHAQACDFLIMYMPMEVEQGAFAFVPLYHGTVHLTQEVYKGALNHEEKTINNSQGSVENAQG